MEHCLESFNSTNLFFFKGECKISESATKYKGTQDTVRDIGYNNPII